MRKHRITYALVLLVAYFIATAAIISSLGIGFKAIEGWSSFLLLAAIFAALAMALKYMPEMEKYKEESPVPGAWAYIRSFRLGRYITDNTGRHITNDKTRRKLFLEKNTRDHRMIYALLTAAMLAFELIPLLLYLSGSEFATLTEKAQALSADIIAEAVLFVLFVFPFLPGFIYLISGFEEVNDEKTGASSGL